MPSRLVPSPAFAASLWLFATLTPAVPALTLVDNFDAPGTDASAELISPSTLFATSFTTGAESATIHTATIKFYNDDIDSHDLVAYLYSSSEDLPGTLLAVSATVTAPSGAPTEAVFDFGAVSVNSLTTYWIVYGLVDFTLFEPVYGWFTSDDAESSDHGWTIGLDSAFSTNGGTSWILDTTDLSYLRITGSLGTIPEPASFALIAGLLGAGAMLRRRLRHHRAR